MLSRRDMLLGGTILPAISLLPSLVEACSASLSANACRLIKAAAAQIGVTTSYDGSYARLDYPWGDVDETTGVCSDVIIRAYRRALDIDLQLLVHQDMRANFASYPKDWGLRKPDSNIDHRRVPNLARFFTRKGAALALDETLKPGDIVTMMLPGNLPHILLVAEVKGERPTYIHNIGAGTELSQADYPITGRFRYLMG